MNPPNETAVKLPLWKSCLEKMREAGLAYEMSWPAEFFEKELRCVRGSNEFAFAMLDLRASMEEEDGYYLRSEKNGELWSIPKAFDHESVAHGFDSKLRRYCVRAINLRSATLMNPKAQLTDGERKKMESGLEKSQVRLALLARSQSVAKLLAKKSPKLLKK